MDCRITTLFLAACLLALPVAAQQIQSPKPDVIVTTVTLTRGDPQECVNWLNQHCLPKGIDGLVALENIGQLLFVTRTGKAVDEVSTLVRQYQQQAMPVPGMLDENQITAPLAAICPPVGAQVMVYPVQHFNARELPLRFSNYLPEGITVTALSDSDLLVTGTSRDAFEQFLGLMALVDRDRKWLRVEVSVDTVINGHPAKRLAAGHADIASGHRTFIPLNIPSLPGVLISQLFLPDDSAIISLYPLTLSKSNVVKDGITMGITAPAEDFHFRVSVNKPYSMPLQSKLVVDGEATDVILTVTISKLAQAPGK